MKRTSLSFGVAVCIVVACGGQASLGGAGDSGIAGEDGGRPTTDGPLGDRGAESCVRPIEGTFCTGREVLCPQDCSDPCRFCNSFSCLGGVFKRAEAPPLPSSSPQCSKDAGSDSGVVCDYDDPKSCPPGLTCVLPMGLPTRTGTCEYKDSGGVVGSCATTATSNTCVSCCASAPSGACAAECSGQVPCGLRTDPPAGKTCVACLQAQIKANGVPAPCASATDCSAFATCLQTCPLR
jgi:hypothetical protein